MLTAGSDLTVEELARRLALESSTEGSDWRPPFLVGAGHGSTAAVRFRELQRLPMPVQWRNGSERGAVAEQVRAEDYEEYVGFNSAPLDKRVFVSFPAASLRSAIQAGDSLISSGYRPFIYRNMDDANRPPRYRPYWVGRIFVSASRVVIPYGAEQSEGVRFEREVLGMMQYGLLPVAAELAARQLFQERSSQVETIE
jgi:hypothetical protein